MTVKDLFSALDNWVCRVYLYLADGCPVPSIIGTYEEIKPDICSDTKSNQWALIPELGGIPETYHGCTVCRMYFRDGTDGYPVIDLFVAAFTNEATLHDLGTIG